MNEAETARINFNKVSMWELALKNAKSTLGQNSIIDCNPTLIHSDAHVGSGDDHYKAENEYASPRVISRKHCQRGFPGSCW